MTMEQNKDSVTTTILYRVMVKPGQWDNFLEVWRGEVKLRQSYGFKVLLAFSDREEGMFTWSYSYSGNLDEAEKSYNNDPERAALAEKVKNYAYTNEVVREVRQELMTEQTEESAKATTILLRRYSIKSGEWEPFLEVWHRIIKVRERHGFKILFALEDMEENMFTWSFSYDGDYNEAAKRYYSDPERVDLEIVANYVTDFKVRNVRQEFIS